MLPLLLLLLVAESSPQLTGTCDVVALGTIALPPGNWSLQWSHVSSIAAKTPDVFIFAKTTTRTERITILRYGPHISPRKPVYLCDSVGDNSLFGIPHFLDANATQRATDGEVEMIRKPRDWNASDISVTYVYPDSDGRMWMSDASLFTQDKSTFVCIHCAPSVLSPSVLTDMLADSSFQSATNPP